MTKKRCFPAFLGENLFPFRAPFGRPLPSFYQRAGQFPESWQKETPAERIGTPAVISSFYS
jgi:hypothetical protein